MAREMKNSGVKWIGDIPSEWVVSKIKYHCAMQSGDNLTSNDIESEGEYAVYGANGFRGYYNQFNCEGTHILIGRQGALAGNVHIVDGKYWATDHAVVTKITDSTNEKFLYYSLISANLNQYAFVTAAQPGLAVSVIINKSIPIPPLPEQQAIAEFLDVKCAEIDGLLADLDAEVKTLAEYKKSIIAETVTRGLNPNVPMKQSGIPWAETIPAHWEMFRLRFVVQIVSGYKNSSSIKVGLENIESWTGKYIPSETEFEGNGNYFGNNDILFGKLRPYLAKVYLAEFEGQAIGDFLVFRTKECAVPKYVKYFLLNPLVIGLINGFTYGAKMPRANWQDISKVFMPIPPIKEQEAIAGYLDEKCAIIDQSIADKQTQIETLKSYKASLIYEYVTGKKQVI